LDRVGAGLEAPSESGAGEKGAEGCWLHDKRMDWGVNPLIAVGCWWCIEDGEDGSG